MSQSWVNLLPASLRKRLDGRPYVQDIMANTAWLLVDRIARMGLGLLVGVWAARYLGPDRFGLLSYALAFSSLFIATSSLGMESLVVRELVSDQERAGEILGTSFVMRLVAAVASIALSIGVIALVRPGDTLVLGMVAVIGAGALFQAFDVIDQWFQACVLSKYTVMAKGAAFLVIAATKVGLILAEAPVMAFALVGTIELALAALGLMVAYHLTHERVSSWRASIERAVRFLKDCWPYILSTMVILLYMRIDQIMLGQMAGDKAVGVYSAAVRLAESWYFVPMAIVSSVFPSIVRSLSVSDAVFYERLQRLYALIALVSYGVAVPVTFLAPWIVRTIYGSEYQTAAGVLVVLVWAGLFTSLGVARSSFLTAMNWTRLYFVTVLLGSLINVALNLVLIPSLGGLGAAIASLIAYWFAAHGSCFLFKPLRKTGWMLTRAMFIPRITT